VTRVSADTGVWDERSAVWLGGCIQDHLEVKWQILVLDRELSLKRARSR
jgi:hypothetical protein